jgi:hypothetical protein
MSGASLSLWCPLFRVVLKPRLRTERRSTQFVSSHDIDLEILLLGLIALGKRYSRNVTRGAVASINHKIVVPSFTPESAV